MRPAILPASVVVPTYNRSDLLGKTLQSLVASTSSRADFEVVVVDDGSSDETFQTVKTFEKSFNLKYVYQPDDGYRVAKARNQGLALAEGEVCIFLDSGVAAATDMIQNHLASHATGRSALTIGYVFGFTNSDENAGRLTLALGDTYGSAADMEAALGADFPDIREALYRQCENDLELLPAPWAMAWTCNISIERNAYEQFGGFDEAYVSWGAEDVDFALKFHRGGVKIQLCRGASAIHLPHPKSYTDNARTVTSNKDRLHAKYGLPETELFRTMSAAKLNQTLLARATDSANASRRQHEPHVQPGH